MLRTLAFSEGRSSVKDAFWQETGWSWLIAIGPLRRQRPASSRSGIESCRSSHADRFPRIRLARQDAMLPYAVQECAESGGRFRPDDLSHAGLLPGGGFRDIRHWYRLLLHRALGQLLHPAVRPLGRSKYRAFTTMVTLPARRDPEAGLLRASSMAITWRHNHSSIIQG